MVANLAHQRLICCVFSWLVHPKGTLNRLPQFNHNNYNIIQLKTKTNFFCILFFILFFILCLRMRVCVVCHWLHAGVSRGPRPDGPRYLASSQQGVSTVFIFCVPCIKYLLFKTQLRVLLFLSFYFIFFFFFFPRPLSNKLLEL